MALWFLPWSGFEEGSADHREQQVREIAATRYDKRADRRLSEISFQRRRVLNVREFYADTLAMMSDYDSAQAADSDRRSQCGLLWSMTDAPLKETS